MRHPFKAFTEEKSLLRKIRSLLILTLATTVVISAALAIFMIVTGVSDENLFRVTGTFALFSGFSIIILLQTASLYRETLVDKINSALGFLSSFVITFWALDSIWSWNVIIRIFGEEYELLGKTMSTFGITIALTSIAGLLRGSKGLNKIIALITFSISAVYYVLWLIRIWAPQWFSEEITDYYLDSEGNQQSSTYMREIEFWSDTFLIVGILLGTMLVISLVNHIAGNKKQNALNLGKRDAIEESADDRNIRTNRESETSESNFSSTNTVELDDATFKLIDDIAKQRNTTRSEIIKELAEKFDSESKS